MRNYIADRAVAGAKSLIDRYRRMPEGRARASLLLLAAALNLVRRLVRPTDHAFIEGGQNG